MLVWTISTLMTDDSEEVILVSAKKLKQVICTLYFLTFQGGVIQVGLALDSVLTLLDLGNEVNAIYPAFAKKLGFVVEFTNVGTQIIDGTIFKTYEMVVAAFSVIDQSSKVKFFKKTFLVANVNPNVVLGMLFLTLSSANIDNLKREL